MNAMMRSRKEAMERSQQLPGYMPTPPAPPSSSSGRTMREYVRWMMATRWLSKLLSLVAQRLWPTRAVDTPRDGNVRRLIGQWVARSAARRRSLAVT
nr:hypothetical protein CFP56_03147 [Quercus suber]